MADDKILVVVPTLGMRLETLTMTLASVASQTGVLINLVVVVPVSATSARSIAAQAGARIVDDPGSGLSAAVNAGIMSADDEAYLAWTGDDDIYRPGGLAHLVELLRANPAASAAFAGCEYIDSAGHVLGTSRFGHLATLLLSWGPNLVPQPASLIRLASLAQVGMYDESLRYAMDLDAFLRLARVGPLVNSRKIVAAFRWHPDSLTVSQHALSTREGQAVKRRYLPRVIRPFATLWDGPLALASQFAAKRVSRVA